MKALTCAGYEYMKLMVSELQRQLDEIEGTKGLALIENHSGTWFDLTLHFFRCNI